MDTNMVIIDRCAVPDGALGGFAASFSTNVPSRWDCENDNLP
jgi:hypothetical protein